MHRVALFGGQVLGVLEQHVLELSLGVHLEQSLPEVHVGEDGGERAARLEGVLGALLLARREHQDEEPHLVARAAHVGRMLEPRHGHVALLQGRQRAPAQVTTRTHHHQHQHQQRALILVTTNCMFRKNEGLYQ